jgi:hypothetical protein
MRLSRRAIALTSVVGGLGLGAIQMVARQNDRQADTRTELFSTERIQVAEGLPSLPRDYAEIPRLGLPLPGELDCALRVHIGHPNGHRSGIKPRGVPDP